MKAKDLITHDLPTLSFSDSGNRALHLMNEYRVFHLPILSRDNYIALVSEDDLLDWDTPEETLSLAEFLTFRPAVAETAHPYEALKLMKNFSLSVLPVVNAHGHFIGCINAENILNFIADNNAIEEPGAIIVLEAEQRNYSMSEIARICESNDVTILGTFIKTIPNSDMQQITVKVNKTEIQALTATFERYNYTVSDVFASENYKENLQENFDMLMHYINL